MIDYNNDRHLMVDIETLGSNSESPIATLCIMRFNPVTGETFESFTANIDLDEQFKAGMKPDANTMIWWLGKSEAAREGMIKSQAGPFSLKEFGEEWNEFISSLPYPKSALYHWGKSPTFDQVILGNLLKKAGVENPWGYNMTRDVRSIESLAPELADEVKFEGSAHIAEDDVKFQIRRVSAVLGFVNMNLTF